MSNIDWSQLITKKMKDAATLAEKRIADSLMEAEWANGELVIIADQLLAIEDDDPTTLPGTDREWRDYRIKVRAWKEGNVDFPNSDKRPVRPTEG